MKYIFGNWKMKLSPQDEMTLARKLSGLSFDQQRVIVTICPTFASLIPVAQSIKNLPIALGAQDCFYEDSGAFTGEISPYALKHIGCEYVIIGHSERRQYLGETDDIINKKVHAAINNMLVPVLCVGETKDQRESGNKDHIVRRQVELALEKVKIIEGSALFIAYEPVWAIGTGNPASIPEITYMHSVIYQTMIDVLSVSVASHNTHILYGGSVDETNTGELLKGEMIHGVLVGGASVKYEEFKKMVEIATAF